MADLELDLPSAGPEPIPVDVAVAAVLGYAAGKRPLRFRSPGRPAGQWVQIPAFGYERFDCRPVPEGELGDDDVLVAEGLHGRLDPAGWTAVRAALDDVAPLAAAAVERAAGRPVWELPDDELSVLGEPGTVGAALREMAHRRAERPDLRPGYVSAALHHRTPALIPHVDRTTRLQLLPHMAEGDSSLEAVIHRELRANAAAFDALESATGALLGRNGGTPLIRVRLHDVLVWLSGSLRLAHALQLGRATPGWAEYAVHGTFGAESPRR
ncbi:MAG: hypothetical protein ACXVX0_15705 [Blastococcus sp.]